MLPRAFVWNCTSPNILMSSGKPENHRDTILVYFFPRSDTMCTIPLKKCFRPKNVHCIQTIGQLWRHDLFPRLSVLQLVGGWLAQHLVWDFMGLNLALGVVSFLPSRSRTRQVHLSPSSSWYWSCASSVEPERNPRIFCGFAGGGVLLQKKNYFYSPVGQITGCSSVMRTF